MEKVSPILLVDDDPVNNFVTYAVFERKRMSKDILIENNGHNALLFLRSYYAEHRSLPPVIFLDINMPVMDGWEFLKHFNKEFHLLRKKVEIVILSATMDEKIQEEGKALGVTHFIRKPLCTEAVEALWQDLFNSKEKVSVMNEVRRQSA